LRKNAQTALDLRFERMRRSARELFRASKP
jgi:hypothetical protein